MNSSQQEMNRKYLPKVRIAQRLIFYNILVVHK